MLHPKGALPTNMGFHHSIFTVRILTVPFLEAPPVGPPKFTFSGPYLPRHTVRAALRSPFPTCRTKRAVLPLLIAPCPLRTCTVPKKAESHSVNTPWAPKSGIRRLVGV